MTVQPKRKTVHVVTDKLTNEEEDNLNYFLRTLKKEGLITDGEIVTNED